MSRFSQNLMYVGILFIIFISCIYFFVSKNTPEPKGIYLPKYSAKLPATDPKQVRIFNLRYQTDTQDSIGEIRVVIAVDQERDFQKLCNQNIREAVKLAAQNGAHEIKYVCLFPEGQITELSSVQLRAYAFRD
ncbi:Francisella virulence factor A [Francisella philomiragia]|uniref:Francisella virulence factor A n=1 Tax=Francisella philomiragia TaxID=28110 RepID=UPI003516BD7C